MFKIGSQINVNDKFQKAYKYIITTEAGKNFAAGFEPFFSPKRMLELGIFEGKYCNDCIKEFPKDWYLRAKISANPNPSLNFFKVKSRQPLAFWQEKGWIHDPDPRGWFQWYCRYWLGRRLSGIDEIQIKRWRTFNRHVGQIKINCLENDLTCRPRQRQALLQWSYNPFI